METTTTNAVQVIVKSVELSFVNYILLALSCALGLAFIAGIVAIVLKEISRWRDAKAMHLKQKLNIRRKGISGGSAVRRGQSCDSFSASEMTSYIQLTETPTSIRCSSAWTPSPVTRNSGSNSPTSGNFSL
ncbi:uncharacterized protein LOC127878014 [Dreissena polymorpha]|uniref:Uncharacterized protein n=1 Tax=Dreissena polymorpha TaxID=45954 RepID=A0A9D4QJV0_DREPO|nr:uncharacterized protein LOC127878014 [Dreissena polymorpha]KAH3834031.1 hypothetical protein DPMN_107349 [Dreissena polymorpha]